LHGRRVFDIQNEKHAKAVRLKGEGFKHGEWKNKIFVTAQVATKPALVRRDVDMQLFSLIMNASLCITASCHARSGPGAQTIEN